ncbi:hypothetical protein VNO80_14912 [Phaseolus coccineus]|uniref:Uncharacterized protein n=1 Tax=Phaseolus coccineus TaxID=3886 RepID=A0AAN9R1C1_PHACN
MKKKKVRKEWKKKNGVKLEMAEMNLYYCGTRKSVSEREIVISGKYQFSTVPPVAVSTITCLKSVPFFQFLRGSLASAIRLGLLFLSFVFYNLF